MNFFHHKDLGNHLLQLCPKVVKHTVFVYVSFNHTLFRYPGENAVYSSRRRYTRSTLYGVTFYVQFTYLCTTVESEANISENCSNPTSRLDKTTDLPRVAMIDTS